MSLFNLNTVNPIFKGSENTSFNPVSFIPKEKPPIYIPNFALDREEEKNEELKFKNFIQEQTNQDIVRTERFKQAEQTYKQQEFDKYVDTLRTAIKENPNAKFMDAEKEAEFSFANENTLTDSALTVSLIADAKPGESVLPRLYSASNSNVRDITFKAVSLYGYLLNPKAEGPQFNELISLNAQTLRYFAERMRGGKNGELWQNSSDWLKRQFEEDPKTKAYLDKITEISPYFFSWEASTSFPFLRTNPLEILAEADASKPDDWDPKRAIEDLKANNPKIAYALFTQMGIPEERLLDPQVSRNPQTFKFYIADALDSFAYGLVMEEFSKQAGSVENATFKYVYPVIRDSLNSNDTLAEVTLIGGGFLLTASGAAAPAGATSVAVGVVSFLSKPLRWLSRSRKTLTKLEQLENLARTSRTVTKTWLQTTNVVGKNIRYLAPHYVGENAVKLLASKNKFLRTIFVGSEKIADGTRVAKQIPLEFEKWSDVLTKQPWVDFARRGGIGKAAKVFGRFSARSLVSGAAQGALEDLIRQNNEIAYGFKTNYNTSALLQNIIEESVGELLLGGAMNFAINPLKTVDLKVSEKLTFISEFEKGLTTGKRKLVDATWNKLSNKTKNKIALVANLSLGLDSKNKQLTIGQQVDLKFRMYDLKSKNDEINEIAPGSFDLFEDTDEFNSVFELLDNSQKNHKLEFFRIASAVMDRNRDPNTGKTTITENQFLQLMDLYLYKEAGFSNNPTVVNKMLGALYLGSRNTDRKIQNRENAERRKAGEENVPADETIEKLDSVDFLDVYSQLSEDQIENYKNYLDKTKEDMVMLIWGSTEKAPTDKTGETDPLKLALGFSKSTIDTINELAQDQANKENKTTKVTGTNLGSDSVVKPQNKPTGPTAEELRKQQQNTNRKVEPLPTEVPSNFTRQKDGKTWQSEIDLDSPDIEYAAKKRWVHKDSIYLKI